MKNALLQFSLILGLLSQVEITAQTNTAGDGTATIQPTIMVIPFAPNGTSLRGQYENNELVRIAITKAKEGFDNRGVNTIDLRAKLKQMGNTEILEDDQKSDMKDEVIKLSGADVYVEIEANKNLSNTGNSATVIMTAYDAFSGESYANKVSNSPKFHTDNFERLVEKALETEIDNFLNTINEKFNDVAKNGRTVVLNVGFDEAAENDFDSEVGADAELLSDLIEDWVYDNAFQNYYHIQGTSSNKMIFDIVKVPLRDDKGRNFRLSSFAAKLRNYVKDLGFDCERLINGNQISITIQ